LKGRQDAPDFRETRSNLKLFLKQKETKIDNVSLTLLPFVEILLF